MLLTNDIMLPRDIIAGWICTEIIAAKIVSLLGRELFVYMCWDWYNRGRDMLS